MLAIFQILIYANIGGERITIQFCDEYGKEVEKRSYNVHRVMFEVSVYLKDEAEKYECTVSDDEKHKVQTEVRLVSDSRMFEIVADLLDDRALDTEVRTKDVVDALNLANILKIKDDKMRLYRNLARAVVNDRKLRAEMETQKDVPDVKLFVLQLMRDHVGMHGVDVRVRGNRATVCPKDERQFLEHGLSDKIGVVDEMRIWDSAMDMLLTNDNEFVGALCFYVCKMDIRALELDHCMLSEGTMRCIAGMRCLTRLSMKELSIPAIKGLSSFKALESLAELDISGNRINNKLLRKIGALQSLTKLSMENCGLGAGCCWRMYSADLRYIERLERLTVLNVSRNKLKKSDMRVIGKMRHLKELKIGHCNLKTGSIKHIKNIENLEMLEISNNRLSRGDLKAIGDIKQLLRLKMSKCVWRSCKSMLTFNTGNLEYVKNLDNLIEIDVSYTSLTKKDMAGIGKLTSLVKIEMVLCRIQPGSLQKLGSLDKLKEINIFEIRKLNKKDRMFIKSMRDRGVLVNGYAGS